MSDDVPLHHVTLQSGQRLAFYERGVGAPLVLLHGIPGSAKSWRRVLPLLPSTRRVLAFDLLGFGASTRTRDLTLLHAEGQAEAVFSALDKLEIASADFVGHDFGGPVALTLFSKRPGAVRTLGLLSPNTFTDTPIPFPLSTTTWPLVGPLARRALFSAGSLRMMLRQGTTTLGAKVDADSAVGDAEQVAAIATIFSASLLKMRELYAPIEESLGRVSVPTLVAWGTRDPFFPVEQGRRLAQAIPGARFELSDGAGHFLPEERPEWIAGLVTQHAA